MCGILGWYFQYDFWYGTCELLSSAVYAVFSVRHVIGKAKGCHKRPYPGRNTKPPGNSSSSTTAYTPVKPNERLSSYIK